MQSDHKKIFLSKFKNFKITCKLFLEVPTVKDILKLRLQKPEKIPKTISVTYLGKGQNYENQNIKIQKECQKCFKASEHRKVSF
jgi:hypothetical protein